MPKINVYLPDELAEAVKESSIPVSAICQRALEQAVRQVTAIRQTPVASLTPDQLDERLAQFTAEARAVIAAATARAGGAGRAGTAHLLASLVDGGHTIAAQVLRTLTIDPERAGHLVTREPGEAEPAQVSAALEQAVTEATSLGHQLVGCEHLLLGLVGEPTGAAGRVLRALGADLRLTRRAVGAVLAGNVHLEARPAMWEHLQPLIERIERLEERLDARAGDIKG